MTTDDGQQQLMSDLEQQQLLEQVVDIHLTRLRAWTRLPDERTDWDLEVLLDDLGTAARALRQLRGDEGLPF